MGLYSFITVLSSFYSEEGISSCLSKQSYKQKYFPDWYIQRDFPPATNIWQDIFHL